MDRRRAGALLALAACVACTAAAPTASNQTALDLYDGAAEGCYYNFQHYGEGDRIMTNEPCLNCTCHNRMLMCYLRVCPFTKPIGQDCTVEKRADQCCPIVTCPDVPVDLLTSTSTTSPAEYGATGLGKLDKYGCSIEGKYFPEGSKVPPTPNKPCEHCYCIRNMTTCVMQECTLHVDGCTPIYHKDVCCPVRYSCDHPEDEMPLLDDMSTTVRPTPGFLLTTTTMAPVTQMTQDCVHDDQIFADGALIKTEKACEHCYCMKGDIVCVVQECGTPMENEGKNCTSLPPREGQCCPDTYICEGDDLSSESTTETAFESITTLSPPRRSSVEGSGYRNEPDDTATFTKMPTQETEYEGSGEEQTTVQPSDHSEKLPSTDEEPSDEIHKLSTISEIPKETEQPKATTEPSILHTTMYPTSEQASVSDIEKDDSSLPVTIEPQEYLPASTSGTEDKEDETTEDYLVTSEPEDLASHHHKPSSIVTESYTDISTEAGEDLNTVPIEETFEPHKHVPTSHDNEKEKEKFTPSVVEKQTEPEERFSSTSGFAESTESTKLGELDVTTKSEKHDLEKDVATTVDSVKDEIEKETVKPHYDATESYPTSAQSVPTAESEKSTTEPDHSQNTVMTAEEDNVLGTKPTDDVKQTTTPQSVESGSGEEDIAEDNLVVPHEHSSTTVSSQQEDTSTTAERESELSDKTLHPSESDESGSKTTIESSTLPYLTTAIKVDQSTVTTEPSFRKEDKIPVSSEKSDRPEVTTSKSDLTEEEFIPASPHDETLSTGVLVTEDETSTLPDQAIDTKEPAITSSTEYSILTETKPSIPSEQESELEPEIPGSESLPEKTTEVSDVDVHQEPSRIPGEGDCLLDGVTYTNNSRVPSNNKCYSGCKCVSSIIKCDPIICSSPPDYMHNCQSIYDTPDSCCPTYVCDHPRETAPPQSDNQMSVTELPMTSSSIECRGDQCEIITVTKKPESTDSEHCGPQGCESGVTKPTDTQLPSDHSDKCHGDQCGISPTDCSDGDCQQVPDQICDPEHGCQAMPVKPCEGEHCKDIIEQSVPHLPAKCEKETGCEDGTQQTVCQGDSCKIDTNIIEPSSETQQPQTKPECTEEACKKTEITPSEGQVTSECKDDECGPQFETTSEENVDLKEGSSVPDIGTTLTPEKSDVTNVYDSQDTSTKKDKPYEAETEKTEDVDKPTVELSTPETIENVHPTETSDIHKQTDTIPELPITDMEPQTSSEGYQTTSQDINEQEITTTSYKTEIVETSTLAQDVTPSKPSEVSLPLDIDDQKQDTTPTISSGDIEYTTVRQEPETDKETSQKPGYDESFEATTVGFSLPAENEQDTDKAVTISSGMPGTDTITSDLSNILSTTTISVDQDKLSTDVSKLEPHVTKSQESSETIGITTEAIATKTPEAYATEGVIPEEPQTIQGHVVEVTTSPTKPDETFTEIEDSFVTGSQGVTTIEPVEKEYFDTTTDRVESVTYEKPEPTETITADVTELQDKTTKTDIVQEEQIAVTPSLPHVDKPHKSIPDHVSVSPTRTPDESTSYEKLDSVTTTLSTEPISQSDQSTESLANELLIPVEPTKTESPEKTPITSDTEDKVINVPQGQETYTTDEPETDTEEPVISPEKEHSETPIENITEQPQEMPEQIDSHTINTDLPSNIAPGKPTTELDIKLEESFTPKPPLQTTETEFQAIDEMRTELPIDQAPETMVTVKEGDGVTPYIPSDKISTESLKETETEKEKLPATTINDTEEVTKSPIKDTGSKVTDKEPKPETGSPVYEEPVTKYPVREMAENEKDVTNIPETKPLGDKTEVSVPSKESNVETTTQQYTDTSATETTSYPVQLEKEKTTQSEIVYEEDKVTKAPVDSPVTELTISQTTGTISSNVQSETDTEYSTGPIDVNVSQLPENEDVTKSPIKDDKYEEDVTKIQVQTSQEPESISTTAQEDIVTKSPVYSGPEGTKEETVTVKPEDTTVSEVLSTKLDEVATKMPEYSEVTKIESTKQEETVTTSSEQTDVTRKDEHVTPQDEMPSSVTESLTVITRVPETSDAYGVQTTKKSEMDAEVTDKTTESEDIPKESITETPGKSEEPEIIVTVLPEMTSKLPEVMKEPESLVTGQDDVITSTAFPGIDDEQPETSDTRRQEPDAATHKDDTTDKTTEIPKDVIPPETEVTSHEQVSTEIPERTTQYYNKVTEAATTESYIDDKEKEQAPDTDEQISSDGTSTSKLPDDTKYVNVAVTSQDNIVTQSPEYETEITKEHEYVTKLPESGEPTTQDEHVTGKTETVAPITDIVTEKQEIISPHENVDKQETTTEQIENIQTTPELVILEEHTHKPVLEASSTLTPFEEEITTVIDETMQYIPVGETPTQKPSLESMEKVTEDATTVSSAVEDIITTVFESTPSEPKPTISSEETISSDLEDKEVSTPSSLVPHEFDKSPISNIGGDQSSEDKLSESKPAGEESSEETSDGKPGKGESTEQTPIEEKLTEDKSGEAKPSEEVPIEPSEEGTITEKPSEDKPSEERPIEGKPSEEKLTDDKKSDGKPSEERPSEETQSEERPIEEKPSKEKPSDSKPSEESPLEEKPSEETPSVESQIKEKPEEETGEAKPTGETPTAEKPSEEKPGEETPVEEKPEEQGTGEAKPTEESPIAEKPSGEKTSEERPVEEKPEEEGTGEAKPTEEGPIAEKPSEETPVEEKPEEEGAGEAKPTEESPTAEKPSGEKASEERPVEEKPEEEGTSEAKPTEEGPIAEKPSEEKPSEESPVEEKPEEEGTDEAKPTGESPITEKPSEEKPSEESPVEEKPEEEGTGEAKPTGETPIAEKPSEEKPSEESPVEEKPEEEGTGEAKPTGETPIAEKPSEEKPSEESPVEEKPEEEGTGEAKPTEESPIAEKPSEEKPSEESPVEEKPEEEGTGEAKPTEEGAIAEKPSQDKTGDDKPTEEGPTAEKPSQDKTGDDKPTEEGPLEERPSAGKPADEGPIEEKPSEGKPSEEGSIHEKPNDVEPTEMVPVEEKPSEKKPEEGKPTEEGSIEEKPSEGKPSEESPIGDKPSEGLPSKDTSVEESEAKPDEESPSKSKPSEEIPIGEKPSDDKTEEGKPSEAKPDEESPIEGKPIEGSPIGEKPSEEKTSESKPSEGKPDGESPIKEKPDESKPSETKPDEESSIEEKPSEGKPSKDKPSEAKPDEESSIEEKPSQGKPTEEQPSEAKPDEESSIEEKPSEGKPSEDKPSEVKPDEESSIEEKPSKGKPSDKSPIEEKPMDDKTGEGRPTEEKPMEPSEPTAETPKPIVPQSTDELPTPEEDGYFPPSGMGYGEPEESEDDQAFGPGTCRYGGKVYVSAQQIPRDDPCDFCFCFRSDIICLQQSCPPPIHGCHEEPIQGFCCPRYECPVSMATTVNVTTTTTTTTTTLPPHFPTHSYKGAAQRRGCQIKGHTYKVGEVVRSASGPCLHCTCGGDGQMKCDPKACTPEPMLRQMIAAAVSAKRRR